MFRVGVKFGLIAPGEEYIFSLFGNSVLCDTLERSREEVTRGWKILHTEKFQDLHFTKYCCGDQMKEDKSGGPW
jgi:hypothetical protein